MTKFKKSIKSILLSVFGVMLLLNAGIDFSRWASKRMAEAVIDHNLKEFVNQFPGASARVVDCYRVSGQGWLCDIDFGAGEQHKRILQFYSNEELKSQ